MKGTYLNITKLKNGKEIPYVRVCAGPQNDKYVHRLIAEALLRRPLKPNETVDHKDQNSLNCAPWNLQVCSWHIHGKITAARMKGATEGVDYDVILDGEKVFNRDDSQAKS
jgi:hypothetical protein